MYLIDNILVDEQISENHFLCDLNRCKGACCNVFGVSGAPLKDEEIDILFAIFDTVKPYLSEKSLQYIEKNNFYQGEPGDYSTNCINNRDCVFVTYDSNNIAYCGIEKAYRDGKTDYKKPISCHLFPVRVGDFGGKALYYEKMSCCKTALYNGKEKDVKIYQMTKEALIRGFGKEWYDKYCNFINNLNLNK